MAEESSRESLLKTARAPRLNISKDDRWAMARAARRFAATPTAFNADALDEAIAKCDTNEVTEAEQSEFDVLVKHTDDRRAAKESKQIKSGESADPIVADEPVDEEGEE